MPGGRGDEVLLDGTDPLDPADDLQVVGRVASLVDGGGFLWDVQVDGTTAMAASMPTTAVSGCCSAASSSTEAVLEDAGPELVIGPIAAGDLRVASKIFVPDDAAFARYLEIIDNTGLADASVQLGIDTNLGSDGGTQIVITSSGDAVLTVDDDYLVTDDFDLGGDPTVTHVFSGPGAAIEPSAASATAGLDDTRVPFQLEVPAGGRAIVLHFAGQSSSQEQAVAGAGRFRSR